MTIMPRCIPALLEATPTPITQHTIATTLPNNQLHMALSTTLSATEVRLANMLPLILENATTML
jgi:hypothetical protein